MDKRIHVTFSDTDREIIEMIAKKENRSLSEVVRRMAEDWMERYEDQYWIDTALSSEKGKTLTHSEVWGNG